MRRPVLVGLLLVLAFVASLYALGQPGVVTLERFIPQGNLPETTVFKTAMSPKAIVCVETPTSTMLSCRTVAELRVWITTPKGLIR